MKEGWKVGRLADLTEKITKGSSPKWQGVSYVDEPGILFVTSENVGENRIDLTKKKYVEDRFNLKDRKSILKRGDVLTNIVGASIGRTAVFDLDCVANINQAVCLIRCLPERIDNRFLSLLLNSPFFLEALHSGKSDMARANLSLEFFRDLEIPLPPLEEQFQIVAVLDEAFEGLARARAHAEANLRDARELFASSVNFELSNLEDCPRRRVRDVAKHSLGKMLDKARNKGTPRPYLRNINVRWFRVDTSDLLEMLIEDHEAERCSVSQGDLLICEGGYPGRAAIWEEEETIFFQKALHRVRFTDPVYAKLLMYHLFAEDYFGRLKDHFSGTGIQHFTGQVLGSFEMPFPSLGVATRFVDQIERLREQSNSLEGQYSAKLETLDALRQSLLQKAFAGELT